MRLYNHQRNKTKSNKQKNHSSGLWNLISSAGDPEKKMTVLESPKIVTLVINRLTVPLELLYLIGFLFSASKFYIKPFKFSSRNKLYMH